MIVANDPIEPLLALESVSKSFESPGDRRQVLANVSLSVWPGEVVGILGRSGCGKSTLLSIAAGIETPDSGSVSTHPSISNRIGYAMQGATLLPWRTALDNVSLALRLQKIPLSDARKRAAQTLHDLGFEAQLAVRPAQLSGGTRQRIALARTLASGAELLLLDEPFSEVDLLGRNELILAVRSYLTSLRCSGALVVSHSIEDAIELCDRLVLLGGRPTRVIGEVESVRSPDRDGTISVRAAATRRAIELLSQSF